MRIAALVTILVCALFMCHTRADTGPRPKRTLRFFENLMNTMRDAFGPDPPDLPPPEVIAKVASLPYSNPYTYFPTVRMHIRPIKPVEKHVVYVKTIPPAVSAPYLMKPNLNDVEIIRLIQPLVRRPKSNAGTIHYEIIPITIPVQEVHNPVNHAPLSTSGDPEFENEDTAFSNVPWSMDALPPPVPTSKPFDSAEDHIVPWQLQALPPPVATKRPYWQPILKPTASNENEIFFPMKKKLMIPASTGHHQQARSNFFDEKFMASPLESEISVQPSVELTAFSETDSMTVPPISNFRTRRVFNDFKVSPKLENFF